MFGSVHIWQYVVVSCSVLQLLAPGTVSVLAWIYLSVCVGYLRIYVRVCVCVRLCACACVRVYVCAWECVFLKGSYCHEMSIVVTYLTKKHDIRLYVHVVEHSIVLTDCFYIFKSIPLYWLTFALITWNSNLVPFFDGPYSKFCM